MLILICFLSVVINQHCRSDVNEVHVHVCGTCQNVLILFCNILKTPSHTLDQISINGMYTLNMEFDLILQDNW